MLEEPYRMKQWPEKACRKVNDQTSNTHHVLRSLWPRALHVLLTGVTKGILFYSSFSKIQTQKFFHVFKLLSRCGWTACWLGLGGSSPGLAGVENHFSLICHLQKAPIIMPVTTSDLMAYASWDLAVKNLKLRFLSASTKLSISV